MSKFNKVLWLAIGASLLNACALLPKEQAAAQRLEITGLTQTLKTDPVAEKIVQEWPKTNWWLAFQNPEINRLMKAALQDNPGLRMASNRLIQAEALADFQAAEMLPSVKANVEFHQRRFSETDFYGPNGGKTFTGAYIDPVNFRYHLDLWGKDQAKLEAALGKERAQASGLAMARLMLSTAMAKSYIQLCSAEEDIELAHALSEKAEQKNRLAQIRWLHGLTNQEPAYVGQQKLEAARQREILARNQAQKLRNRLAALAGQGPDWGQNIKTEAGKIMGHLPEPEAIKLGLLAHRPDVTAALWQAEAAAQMVKVAKTNFYPDIDLVGFAGLRSLNLKDLFLSNGASVAYGMGPTLSLPIFEGGRLEAELKNQQAAYDAAIANYNAALLSAVQQVADSLAEWRKTLQQNESQARALQAAENESKLADKRYQAGITPLDDKIEAEASLIQQRLTASEQHNAHLLAAIGLIEALGGGYPNTEGNKP